MKIKAGTVARTVCLVIALVNQVLMIFGKDTIAIANDKVYQIVSVLFTIGAALAAWWSNNSFTTPAIKADCFLKEEKEAEKEQG